MHDIQLARDAREVRLAHQGVPREYWSLTPNDIGFASIKAWGGRKVSPAEQRFWFKSLIKQQNRQKCIIASATEDAGLALATAVAVNFGYEIKNQEYQGPQRIISVDAQYLPAKREPHQEVAIVLVHNVLANAPAERIMKVRDILVRYPKSVRMVVVLGTKDPWGWSMNNLVIRPDICCLATKVLA